MKIGILKGGANITFSQGNASAANADILYAIRTINPKEHEITCITHRTRNTIIPKPLKFLEIQDASFIDFDDFDVILLFNFSINFFGGVEDPNIIRMYQLLSQTITPIAFILTDGQLPFRNIWPSIWKRDWAKKYKETDFIIDPEQVIYLSQGRDVNKTIDSFKKKEEIIYGGKYVHFPWEKTILSNHEKHFKDLRLIPLKERKYTLVYGGASRNSYRRKRIEYYYDTSKYSVFLFGNLRGVHAPNAEILGKVPYQQMIPMMMNGKATIIIGDESYENNFHTLRMYESILAGNLVLIDRRFDSESRFYDGDTQFLVNSTNDIKSFKRITENDVLDIRRAIINSYKTIQMKERLVSILEGL